MRKYNLLFLGSLFILMLYCLFMICLVSGCRVERDTDDDKTWTSYHEGKIKEIYFYYCEPIFHEDHIHYYQVQINFHDKKVVKLRYLSCDHEIKIDDYGELLVSKDENEQLSAYNNQPSNNDFRWIKKIDTTTISSKPKVGTIPEPKAVVVKEPLPQTQKYEWKNASLYKPIEDTTVLLKLEDGIITTGYITRKGEWKLDVYRNKINGGFPIDNVDEWKEVVL